MSLQTWQCEVCGKQFEPGAWTCTDGLSNHIVAEKTYRCLDAPTAPGKQAEGTLPPIVRGRTRVCNIPPPRKLMEGTEIKWVGEGYVEFINGAFSTKDPEQQYWLDKKPVYNATEEQWKGVWLTQDERLAEKELALKAMEQRLENDRNALLEKTKQRVTAGAK